MGNIWICSLKTGGSFNGAAISASEGQADLAIAECLVAATNGNTDACYDLGVAYSTGSQGLACDLIEAHKWFNLAAVAGHSEAAQCRADISSEMTVREISEAQRRARQWLAATTPSRRAA